MDTADSKKRISIPPPVPVDALEKRISISIVLPCYNEKENLPTVLEEIQAVVSRHNYRAEVIAVDDGSNDGTRDLYPSLIERFPMLRVLLFKRNFGQTAAMMAGFEHATGDVVIPMDADLQNDPSDIPVLLEKMNEGHQVVSGWRKNRKDRFISRRLPSIIANRLISIISGVKLHDYGCSLKAYRRDALTGVNLYGEMHRFIPIYASWTGASVAEVEVNHRARKHGKSKYGLDRTLKVILDLLTVKFLGGYSQKPIHFFGIPGLFMILAGFLVGVWVYVQKLMWDTWVHKNPLLILSVLLLLLGFQMIMIGLLAEVIIRTYHEAQGKKTYHVEAQLPQRERSSIPDA